jgi:hypothetical protein
MPATNILVWTHNHDNAVVVTITGAYVGTVQPYEVAGDDLRMKWWGWAGKELWVRVHWAGTS